MLVHKRAGFECQPWAVFSMMLERSKEGVLLGPSVPLAPEQFSAVGSEVVEGSK